MTTSIEAAKALESFGWALVKYAQKVKAGNMGMAHKWWLVARVRQYTAQRLRKEAWGQGLSKRIKVTKKYTAGMPIRSSAKIDILVSWPRLGNQMHYDIPAWAAVDIAKHYIKAWRPAV